MDGKDNKAPVVVDAAKLVAKFETSPVSLSLLAQAKAANLGRVFRIARQSAPENNGHGPSGVNWGSGRGDRWEVTQADDKSATLENDTCALTFNATNAPAMVVYAGTVEHRAAGKTTVNAPTFTPKA